VAYPAPSRTRQEGRCAASGNVERGMRWTRSDRWTWRSRSGRRRRVVLAPLGWCQVCETFGLAGDGDYEVTDTGESAQQALKPSRREGRNVSAYLWWTYSYAFPSMACEAAGAQNTRLSLHPLSSRDKVDVRLGRVSAARMLALVHQLFDMFIRMIATNAPARMATAAGSQRSKRLARRDDRQPFRDAALGEPIRLPKR